MADPLVAAVAAALEELTPAGATVLVAVSGGPDSIALLELLHRGRAAHRRTLHVGHVDHGIAPESAAVATMVEQCAGERALPFHKIVLALGPAASETRARRARRDALEQMAEALGADAIATAHHADDQAETILLRLLRGSGPAGLAGMAPRAGRWLRPLLETRRDTLHAWCALHNLAGWQDPANRDPRHLRSWLRQGVLPILTARLPDVVERLTGAGRHASTSRTAWDEMPDLLPALDLQRSGGVLSVAAPPLRGYRSEVRRALFGALGRRAGALLGERRLGVVERLLMHGRAGTIVRVDRWLEVELSGDRLHFRRPEHAVPGPMILPARGDVGFGAARFAIGLGTAEESSRTGVVAWFPGVPLEVRAWQFGDRIRPLGGTGSRRVASLLREAGVPSGVRAHWPVVVGHLNGEAVVLWVPGICRADAAVPEVGTEAVRVEYHLGGDEAKGRRSGPRGGVR